MAENKTDKGIKNVKQRYAELLAEKVRIAKFNGTVIIQSDGQWYDMNNERFAAACYSEFGSSISKSMITDLEHLFRTTAEDMSHMSHYILFEDRVWNTKKVEFDALPSEDWGRIIYGIPYTPRESKERLKFILDLASGDVKVYDDIMQSVAPLIMNRKPTGIIWYLGMGSNGKSALVHLLHLIFGNYLTQITVKQLEDERDAPHLNGKIGNIPTESSESLIKDTRTYKSIGTHEDFMVHKFHSQEMTSVNGNVHHIFSTNNIPTFTDKSDGAKRRTLIIPFNNHFEANETFEDETFTKDFIEQFLGEMIKYARLVKQNKYSYTFSSTSRAVKQQYDLDSNPAATYADELIMQGVVGFTNFRQLGLDFDNWCSDNGYMAASVNVFRRTMRDKGYSRQTRRVGKLVDQVYMLKEVTPPQSENFGNDRPGLLKLIEVESEPEETKEDKENRLL